MNIQNINRYTNNYRLIIKKPSEIYTVKQPELTGLLHFSLKSGIRG